MNMGLGMIGTNDRLVFKRKYRWTFRVKGPCGDIPEHYVKLAARPNLSIEETEINFLHGKTWLPGKGTWETITVTYYDVGNAPEMQGLYNWIASVFDFARPLQLFQSSRTSGYSANAELQLYDGCGTVMETWNLQQVWPQAINFGELDYSSSEEVTIEMTLRYTNVEFKGGCGLQRPECSCKGC